MNIAIINFINQTDFPLASYQNNNYLMTKENNKSRNSTMRKEINLS